MGDDNRSRMHVYIGPGFREQLRRAAQAADLSMASYIRLAVARQMQHDAREQAAEPPAPAFLQQPEDAA